MTTYLIGLNPLLKLTGIITEIRFGSRKSEDNSMHVQQNMNAFLPVKTSIFEMLGSDLAKVAVGGVGLEASALLTSFATSAMI